MSEAYPHTYHMQNSCSIFKRYKYIVCIYQHLLILRTHTSVSKDSLCIHIDLCEHREEADSKCNSYNEIYSDNSLCCRTKSKLEYSRLTAEIGNLTRVVAIRLLHVQRRSPMYQTAD